MSKLETNQVDPATGTTLTLGTSGDTITIPSGVTIANSGTATGFGGDNTPMFLVSGGSGSADAKVKVMSDCGFVMSESPSGLGEAVVKAIEEWK